MHLHLLYAFPCAAQVWFKHDLRVADHPGLLAAAAAAAAAGGIVPFFCLDPQQYAYLALMPGGAEGVLLSSIFCVPQQNFLSPSRRQLH
jgi:hypothetical protein